MNQQRAQMHIGTDEAKWLIIGFCLSNIILLQVGGLDATNLEDKLKFPFRVVVDNCDNVTTLFHSSSGKFFAHSYEKQ
jgi:hypothetical protein